MSKKHKPLNNNSVTIENQPRRAILYGRVSGDDRHKEGRNLDGQIKMCREYARAKGYSVVAELTEDDRGASGASFELPQLKRAYDMVKTGECDVFITREVDRLSRNLAKQLIVESELKRYGVDLEYVLGEYPDTPEGNLNKHIRAVIAEFERDKIQERMVRGRNQKVENGHVLVHSTPPYGYAKAIGTNGKATLEIIAAEGRIIKLIYHWYTVGDESGKRLSMQVIAEKLSKLQIPTRLDTEKGKGGHKKQGFGIWNRAMIAKVLHSEVYKGVWHYGKNRDRAEWLEVSVPPIVDIEVWDEVKRICQLNKEESIRNHKYHYLLTGRIRCAHCGYSINGHPMQWRSKNAHGVRIYYRCAASRSAHGRIVQCDLPQFRADQVDAAVWGWLCELLADPQSLQQGIEAYGNEHRSLIEGLTERLKVVDDLLNNHRDQLSKLLDLYLLESQFTKEMLVDRETRLRKTITSLEAERHTLNEQIQSKIISNEQMDALRSFAGKVVAGLTELKNNFEARQRIIRELDVRVNLAVEEGLKIIYVRCMLAAQTKLVVPTLTRDRSADESNDS